MSITFNQIYIYIYIYIYILAKKNRSIVFPRSFTPLEIWSLPFFLTAGVSSIEVDRAELYDLSSFILFGCVGWGLGFYSVEFPVYFFLHQLLFLGLGKFVYGHFKLYL